MTLVAYATSYGSTAEVAEAVAKKLREKGAEVEVQNMKKLRSLEGYDAVVLGVPLYMFKLHKDARRMLGTYAESLKRVPVALFALGPFNDDEKEWDEAREQLRKEVEKYPWLNPVSQEVFGGKFDPSTLRFPFSLIPALKKLPAGDVRDWDAIAAWADRLPAPFYS